ncbi:hypothetical protein TSAR_008681 [Trichomalopsis sarcophagae]|uniref:SMP-30/Gluconolactonase/LRE-like region domain-containing protein n=1 Tax=Trichomalopsis sarcophagae TaxID=543379 RepID=A0A232EJE4_9HYME|nr:hypothetical protein TSAR_008681 [Trichomalopsis sarcophagae]
MFQVQRTMGPEIENKVIINRGSLYKIDSTLLTTKIISPVSISNGIAWNIDDSKFYYIDSPTRKIISYNYNSLDGNIIMRTEVNYDGPCEGTFWFSTQAKPIVCHLNLHLTLQLFVNSCRN